MNQDNNDQRHSGHKLDAIAIAIAIGRVRHDASSPPTCDVPCTAERMCAMTNRTWLRQSFLKKKTGEPTLMFDK